MRMRFSALLMFAAASAPAQLSAQTPAPPASKQSPPTRAAATGATAALDAARTAFRSGHYDEAITALRPLAASPGAAQPAAAKMLARALAEVGRYDEAEAAARAASASSPEVLTTLGNVLLARGKRDEADQAFAQAIQRGASDSLSAELGRALILEDRGQREAARKLFDHFIDVYNGGRNLGAEDLTAVATAVRHLGGTDPSLFKDALRAYDEAAAADPTDPAPRLAAGDMLLAKYNGADARKSFEAVLQRNPRNPEALLGLARVLDFDGRPGAADAARKALAVNPNLVPAHLLLARLALTGDDYDQARKEAGQALTINPASRDALAVLAAIAYVRGDDAGFEDARRRDAALDPRDADFFATAAELAVQSRRYAGAVELAKKALALDSASSRARGLLGLNQLRQGEIEAGRASLEAAFKADPYNVWYKNTLDLLDTFEDYRTTPTADFRFVIADKESDLIEPYAAALAEEAFSKLSAKYGYRPDTPVRVEVYPRHADFSVRTVGLTGLGALGVTFGKVVAMDSPAARDRGDFNWGSTLWHELSHVFHLGMTGGRVPRWLTEGLAVYEERQARPGWGFPPDPGFLRAFHEQRLAPVSRLNDGFVHPSYPDQVVHSYYEASLVVEMIAGDDGFPKILDMLHAYARGATDDEVFRKVLKLEPAALDAKFDDYLRTRFAGAMNPAFASELKLGTSLFEHGQPTQAVPHLERAKSLFPDYAGPGNPYALLAKIDEQRGELRQAADELSALVARNETAYDERLELAGLLERLGDPKGAADALDGALYISPYDPSLHTRLAALYASLRDWPKAIRERRAVVALAPVDRAEALYQLALVLYQSGDLAGARKQVLRALETAPDFRKAQDLLLQLHDTSGGGAP